MTNRNYENLPEIKQKKEEEKKKNEYKMRQQVVKKYAEDLEKKRKNLYQKSQAGLVNEGIV